MQDRDAFAAKYGWRPISEFDSTGSYTRVVFLHWSDDKPQICLRRQQAIYVLGSPFKETDDELNTRVEWSTATHFKET
jgi:hypothetical protein